MWAYPWIQQNNMNMWTKYIHGIVTAASDSSKLETAQASMCGCMDNSTVMYSCHRMLPTNKQPAAMQQCVGITHTRHKMSWKQTNKIGQTYVKGLYS